MAFHALVPLMGRGLQYGEVAASRRETWLTVAWLLWKHDGRTGLVDVPTHAELAWQLNTTRESVTRVMKKLVQDGLIERQDEQWRVTAEAALAEWARGARS